MSTVSAIIVNWNGKDLLSECLESLRRQRRVADEILIVDNGSSDGSQAMIRTCYPEVTLIELDSNRGFSAANNIGIRRARGDYLALLNNDLVLDREWIAGMTAALDADQSLGSCACKMLSYSRRDMLDAAGISILRSGVGANRGMAEVDLTQYQHTAPVFGPCAGATLCRAAMLHDIGLFDEDLYLYYEDVDLAFRAQLAGYNCLYVPAAIAYHHHSASSSGAGSTVKDYYLARNSLLVVVKNMPSPILFRSLRHIVIGQLPYAYYAAARGNLKLYFRACLDTIRMLPRMLRKRRAIQCSARRSSEDMAARLTL